MSRWRGSGRRSAASAFRKAAEDAVAAYLAANGPRFAKIADAAGVTGDERSDAARNFTVCDTGQRWWRSRAPSFEECMAAAIVLPDPDAGDDAWQEIADVAITAEASTAAAHEAGRIALSQALADWRA